MEKFYLELPSMERKREAIEYIEEFYEYGSQIHGTGSLDRELKKGRTYEEWLNNNIKLHDADYALEKGLVPAYTYFLIREDDNKLVAMIDLRLGLNEYLRNFGGHIGYSVRPTERKKGYNKINLYLILQVAKNHGLDKVLITCSDSNEGSRKTILSLGGKFKKNNYDESDNETMELYWIDVNDSLEKYKDIYEQYISNNKVK
ncbi:MAG: GNAT family N-acetyltransferase [Clostridia bacterium]|nr:GNAT family N-acetyltransferase [Clostridia bacterium]